MHYWLRIEVGFDCLHTWLASILRLFVAVVTRMYLKTLMLIQKAWYHPLALLRMQCCHCQLHTIITVEIRCNAWHKKWECSKIHKEYVTSPFIKRRRTWFWSHHRIHVLEVINIFVCNEQGWGCSWISQTLPSLTSWR